MTSVSLLVLEDGAAMFQFAAPFGGVGEIAVVAEGDFAFVAVNHDGLRVEESLASAGALNNACGRWRRLPGKLGKHRGLKNFLDVAHGAVEVEFGTVARNNAGGFLAAMLKRVKPEIGEIGGFGMAEDAEHTTLVVKMIVGNSFQVHVVLAPCCLNSSHVAGRRKAAIDATIGSKMRKRLGVLQRIRNETQS